MKTIYAAGIAIAGLAMVAVAAHGQRDTTAPSTGPKAVTAVDEKGNLHVPDAYRTTFQALGSWAVAADQGQGSKELHVVYASPGTIAAYRESGHFPDGAVLVKEVFQAATGPMTTGTVSRAETLPAQASEWVFVKQMATVETIVPCRIPRFQPEGWQRLAALGWRRGGWS